MKLSTCERNGNLLLCVGSGERVFDLTAAFQSYRPAFELDLPKTMIDLLTLGERGLDLVREIVSHLQADGEPDELAISPAEVRFLAPVPRPGKIICLSGNYREHIAEYSEMYDKSALPLLFIKPATTVTGHETEIRLPKLAETVVWELELAVVIGKQVHDISVDDAYSCVAGYTIANDVSARRLTLPQGRVPGGADRWHDWLTGKWFDTFAPMGPWLVTKDEIPDPHTLSMELRLNGQTRQRASTASMIQSVPDIVSFASRFMTLEPGDVFFTGTSAELGPKERMLQSGDIVEASIDRLGTLRNFAQMAI